MHELSLGPQVPSTTTRTGVGGRLIPITKGSFIPAIQKGTSRTMPPVGFGAGAGFRGGAGLAAGGGVGAGGARRTTAAVLLGSSDLAFDDVLGPDAMPAVAEA